MRNIEAVQKIVDEACLKDHPPHSLTSDEIHRLILKMLKAYHSPQREKTRPF